MMRLHNNSASVGQQQQLDVNHNNMSAIESMDVDEANDSNAVKHAIYNLRSRTIVPHKAPYNLRPREKRQIESDDYAQHDVIESRVEPQLQNTDLQCEDEAKFYAEMSDLTFKEIKKRMCSTPKKTQTRPTT